MGCALLRLTGNQSKVMATYDFLLYLRTGETESLSAQGTGAEGERVSGRLHARQGGQCTARSRNPEITTRAQNRVRNLTEGTSMYDF